MLLLTLFLLFFTEKYIWVNTINLLLISPATTAPQIWHLTISKLIDGFCSMKSHVLTAEHQSVGTGIGFCSYLLYQARQTDD